MVRFDLFFILLLLLLLFQLGQALANHTSCTFAAAMPEFFLYSLFLLRLRIAVSLLIFVTLTLARTNQEIPTPWYKERG